MTPSNRVSAPESSSVFSQRGKSLISPKSNTISGAGAGGAAGAAEIVEDPNNLEDGESDRASRRSFDHGFVEASWEWIGYGAKPSDDS